MGKMLIALAAAIASIAVMLTGCGNGPTPVQPVQPVQPSGPPWKKPNTYTKLIPPQGTGWRGSIIGWDHSGQLLENVRMKYGFPLQIYRLFQKYGITDEMREFVLKGGILWYNTKFTDWKVVGTKVDPHDHAGKMAEEVKSLAPAQVMVCIGHEADHDIDAAAGQSVSDYKNMFVNIQERFKQEGVTNAVWVMDYSVGIIRPLTKLANGRTQQYQNALDMWPGKGRVDWLFFNIFQRELDEMTNVTYDSMVTGVYEQFMNTPDDACKETCGFKDIPWGVGAFGPASLQEDPNAMPRHAEVSVPGQITFWEQAAAGIPKFPRIRAYIPFDSLDSQIQAGPRSGPGMTAFHAYVTFMNNPYFKANDPPTGSFMTQQAFSVLSDGPLFASHGLGLSLLACAVAAAAFLTVVFVRARRGKVTQHGDAQDDATELENVGFLEG